MDSPIHILAPSNGLTGSPPPISALPLDNISMGGGVFGELKKDIDPWQVCNDRAKEHTEDLCESWREEVDNLLIFAGLFSGVVTTFAIESYHSVKEDPADTTVLLLRTIIHQLGNMADPQLRIPIDLDPSGEKIPRSEKRINTFWFLSLALSLSTVMAGILCLQWIREYGRNANLPHREDVALHYMRYEGMKKWQVPKILRALPLLLIGALLLFFAGFIEVLWEVDKTAAILVAIVVGVAFIFILMTTVLPTLQYLLICIYPNSECTQCPYKSPQAWIFFKIVAFFAYFFSRRASEPDSKQSASEQPSRLSDAGALPSWPDYDRVLRKHRDAGKRHGTRDVGRGLAWIGENFVQHQKVVEAMNSRRANSVRRYVDVSQRRLKPGSTFDPEPVQDLIVCYTLEYLAQKMEQTHMSSKLLHQRLDLFLKIREGTDVDQDVDCPVNRDNVNQIHREKRDRILDVYTQCY